MTQEFRHIMEKHALPSSFPSIRLFAPDQAAGLTLRQAFEKYVLPDIPPENRGTLGAYRTALNHWEKLADNPPIDVVTDDTLRKFRDDLLATGAKISTVRKTWRQLRPIFRRVGPRHDRNPQGAELLEKLPYLKLPEEPEKAPRDVSNSELSRVWESCSVASWPCHDGIPPAARWRALIAVFYNCGPRTQDVVRLRWQDIDFKAKLLTFTTRKTKRGQRIPMNSVLIAHLEAIKGNALAKDKLFPGFGRRVRLYETWKLIQQAAGIEKPIEFRDLRETCNTRYRRFGADVACVVLGHKARGVNERYYWNPTKQVRDAARRLTQPKAFQKILSAPNPAQQTLF